jgi:hypothetical protein
MKTSNSKWSIHVRTTSQFPPRSENLNRPQRIAADQIWKLAIPPNSRQQVLNLLSEAVSQTLRTELSQEVGHDH